MLILRQNPIDIGKHGNQLVWTALINGCRGDHPHILSQALGLLSFACTVAELDSMRALALQEAAQHRVNNVGKLLVNGDNSFERSVLCSALVASAALGHVPALQTIIELDKSSVLEAVDFDSAFRKACENGVRDAAEFLKPCLTKPLTENLLVEASGEGFQPLLGLLLEWFRTK